MKSALDIGPFGRARKIIHGTAYNMARGFEFQNLIKKLEEANGLMEKCESEMEKKLTQLVIDQLEERINQMITPPEIANELRNKEQNDKVPGKAL